MSMFLLPLSVHAGFGVSPPQINEEHAVGGASFDRTIYLVQGNPDRDLPVSVSVESKDSKDWISFPNGNSFVIPKGVQQFPLEVHLAIPQDTPLGIYKAFIRIATTPDKATGAGQVAVAIGARVDVEITVGDEVFSQYTVGELKILDIAVGDPLQATLKIRNTGNVPTAPVGASFELFDKFGAIRLAFVQVGAEDFVSVPSFSEKEVALSFPVDLVLAEGEYWGHVKVFDDKGNVVQQLRTVFNVKKGTLGSLAAVFASPFAKGVGGGLLVVLLAAVVFLLFRMSTKRAVVSSRRGARS